MGDYLTLHSNNDENYLINPSPPFLIPELLDGIPTNGFRRLPFLLMSSAGAEAEGSSATTLYHDISYDCIHFGVGCMAFLEAGLFAVYVSLGKTGITGCSGYLFGALVGEVELGLSCLP